MAYASSPFFRRISAQFNCTIPRYCLNQKNVISSVRCDRSMPNFSAFKLICSRICCKSKSQEARKPLRPLFVKEEKKSINVTNSLTYANTASVVYEQTAFCNVYDAFVAKHLLSNLTWASIHT